jgi:hypothetical protein
MARCSGIFPESVGQVFTISAFTRSFQAYFIEMAKNLFYRLSALDASRRAAQIERGRGMTGDPTILVRGR